MANTEVIEEVIEEVAVEEPKKEKAPVDPRKQEVRDLKKKIKELEDALNQKNIEYESAKNYAEACRMKLAECEKDIQNMAIRYTKITNFITNIMGSTYQAVLMALKEDDK